MKKKITVSEKIGFIMLFQQIFTFLYTWLLSLLASPITVPDLTFATIVTWHGDYLQTTRQIPGYLSISPLAAFATSELGGLITALIFMWLVPKLASKFSK